MSRCMVFNATFNNISVISWHSVLLEETGVPGENHQPVASLWPTLGIDCTGSCKSNYYMITTMMPITSHNSGYCSLWCGIAVRNRKANQWLNYYFFVLADQAAILSTYQPLVGQLPKILVPVVMNYRNFYKIFWLVPDAMFYSQWSHSLFNNLLNLGIDQHF